MEQDTDRAPKSEFRHVPGAFRQGLITAITVLLGFSLAFFRYWGFEATGEWTTRSVIAALPLAFAVVMQIVALVRSLRLEDDDPAEYRRTVTWFTSSAIVLLAGLLFATIVS